MGLELFESTTWYQKLPCGLQYLGKSFVSEDLSIPCSAPTILLKTAAHITNYTALTVQIGMPIVCSAHATSRLVCWRALLGYRRWWLFVELWSDNDFPPRLLGVLFDLILFATRYSWVLAIARSRKCKGGRRDWSDIVIRVKWIVGS